MGGRRPRLLRRLKSLVSGADCVWLLTYNDFTMIIRPVTKNDRAEWLRMRCALWPGHEEELGQEVDRFFSGSIQDPRTVLVAEEGGKLVGMVELTIHPGAPGCYSGRVGYLEAWYVDADVRCRGIGRALIKASEDWARSQGCPEFASDCEVDNEISARAYRAIGFEEVETIRCFRKSL